jgi:hypothetical protein
MLKTDDDADHGEQAPRVTASAAGPYDPDNKQQLKALLATIYADLSAVSDQAEVVAFYAGFSCEVAIFVRAHGNVDLGNVAAAPAAQPLLSALPALEIWIEDYFNHLTPDARHGELDAQEKMQRLATQARMRAACVWKGYVLALHTPPEDWDVDAVCALGALAILSTADPARVVGAQRNTGKADFIRDNARDGDWPPRAAVELCWQHGDLLADKLQALRSRN